MKISNTYLSCIVGISSSEAHRKWIRAALNSKKQVALLKEFMSDFEIATLKTAVGAKK